MTRIPNSVKVIFGMNMLKELVAAEAEIPDGLAVNRARAAVSKLEIFHYVEAEDIGYAAQRRLGRTTSEAFSSCNSHSSGAEKCT